MRAPIFRLLLLALLAPCAAAGAQQAAGNYHAPGDFRGDVDQEGARAAVRRGDAAPFTDILRKARPLLKGEIVGQKLEQHRGLWVYEFRVVGPDGHMRYMHFDAKSGAYVDVRPAP